MDGDKAGRFSLPSNPVGSNPGSQTSRSLSPFCPQPPRRSEGRAGTETAARGEGAAAPPAPLAAIAASPDPLRLCTTRSGARCPAARMPGSLRGKHRGVRVEATQRTSSGSVYRWVAAPRPSRWVGARGGGCQAGDAPHRRFISMACPFPLLISFVTIFSAFD